MRPTESSSRPRVLCGWDITQAPSVLDALRSVAEVEVRETTRAWLLEHIGEYDVYLPALALRFDAALAARAGAGRTGLIYTPSTGTDHLDLHDIQEQGIEVRSIREEWALLDRVTATAELALALLLAAARRIPGAHQSSLAGHWSRDAFRGYQLAGKTLGVLGVGRLGRMMVDYARGLRMNVVGCDPNPLRPIDDLEYLPYESMAPRCDVLSVHIHLTPENRHFLDAQRLGQLKRGALLVNTSRGGIIDEAALIEALRSGQLAAAGLDVIDGEWNTDLVDHPLIRYAREHDNLVITPHVGGVTHESQAMVYRYVAEQTALFIQSRYAHAPESGCPH